MITVQPVAWSRSVWCPASRPAMLVIVEFQLRENARAKFERALLEMNARIESYDGYLGEEPCQALSDSSKFVTLFRFEDRDAVEAWRNDEVHLKTQA